MVARTMLGRTPPVAGPPNEEWSRWAQDFESIFNDLQGLGIKRQIHRAHRKVLAGFEDLDGRRIEDGTLIVHHWMQENYADSMLIGLRRIVDRTKGVRSAIKLLEELEKGRPLVTFERYVQFWGSERQQGGDSFARLLFSRFSSDGKTLDRTKIKSDIEKLLASHDVLLTYIGTSIAHRSKVTGCELESGPAPGLTWDHLDAMFEDIFGLLNKYYALVKPGTQLDLESGLPAGFDRAFHRMVPSANVS